MEVVKFEFVSKEYKSGFGRMFLEVKYQMTHVKHGRVNKYIVTGEVLGIETASPYISISDAEFMGDIETDSNDETLTNDSAQWLFEDHFINN